MESNTDKITELVYQHKKFMKKKILDIASSEDSDFDTEYDLGGGILIEFKHPDEDA